LAVVVRGDRAGPDVDVGADRGVAEVAEVVHLRAASETTVLDLGVIEDVDATREIRAGADVAVRSDRDLLLERGALEVGLADARAVADDRVAQTRARSDDAASADACLALEDGPGQELGVFADADAGIDEGRRGVAKGDAGEHVPLSDARAQQRLGRRELITR